MTLLIWLYTRRGGIKTLVWTDTFQTTCMFAALLLIIYNVTQQLGMSVGEAVRAVAADGHSRMFVWDDWVSTQNFWKQLLSGAFIAIVMTGLDQDMMQKNLTCKSLREAQKDVCTYGFAFVPANLLFMALGVLLMMLAQKEGTPLPAAGDELLPMFAATAHWHCGDGVLHHRHRGGIVLQCRLGAHGAHHELLRRHLRAPPGRASAPPCACGIAVVFVAFILLFRMLNSTSVIDAIYVLCSYTYGPLLGLFAFGLLTRRAVNDRLVPYVCLASPLLCYALDITAQHLWGYRFGYELLMINGAFTFAGLWATNSAKKYENSH